MADSGDSVHIPKICFDMCETLKAVAAPEDLERYVDYDKERVESCKLEIKRMLSVLTAPGSVAVPDEMLGADARAPYLAPVDPPDTTPVSEGGTSPTPPSSIIYRIFITS